MGTRENQHERLSSPCQRMVMACACIVPKNQYMDTERADTEYPYPIQAEDTSPTDVQGTKVQYVIASDELDHEQLLHADLDEDDIIPSVPNISMETVDSVSDLKLDSLEDQLCQMLVMQFPAMIKLRRQLKEQRFQQQKELKLKLGQQIEREVREYNKKFEEFQQHVMRMQLRKEFFKNMQGINT